MPDRQSIKIQLTPEQQEMIRRLSGQNAEAMEIAADPAGESAGGPLRFLWRLSTATGIPRQQWVHDANEEPSA
jgi:hypothetical protein